MLEEDWSKTNYNAIEDIVELFGPERGKICREQSDANLSLIKNDMPSIEDESLYGQARGELSTFAYY